MAYCMSWSVSIFLYFAIGKLLIYLFQIAKPHYFHKLRFLDELFECDLCLVVWVYFFLALMTVMDFFDCFFYVPIVSAMLTGMTASFIMHLISIGWKDKFSTIVVE